MKPTFSAMSEYPGKHTPLIENIFFETAAEDTVASEKGRIVCPACGGDSRAHCPWDNCYLKNFIPESVGPH
jgi:hypothetical protein